MEEPEEEEEEEEEKEAAGSGDNESAGSESASSEAVYQFLESKKIPHDQWISSGGSPAHHYTDLEGLRGIVEKDDLWLTNARYSNDEEEMEHGFEITRNVIRQEKEKRATPAGRSYIDHLEKLLNASVPERYECYICCFCQKRDLLSQWRAYAGYGSGVAVEIDMMRFSDLTTKCSAGRLYYWMVRYQDFEKMKRVKDIIDFFGPSHGESATGSEKCAWQAAEAIKFFIPTFKDVSFIEEAEWRLIFVPSMLATGNEPGPKPQFRVSRNLLVPYYRLRDLIPAERRPITGPQVGINRVTVGPCHHKELIAESVRMLLSQYGHAQNVDVSNTPYRG